jgi:hypothetical protein
MNISSEDRKILRELAQRVAEIAAMPLMAERRDLWRRHNNMEQVRPVVYVEPEGAWGELLPDQALLCREQTAREIERDLRRRIYMAEHFASDNVIEKEWIVRKVINSSGWGLEPHRTHSENSRGAYGFSPVIETPSDLKKLRIPEISHDETATREQLELFQSLFGDILTIRLKGVYWLSYHLMNQFSALRGLQELLMDMIENPGMVHDAMAFLEEGHRQILRQYVDQNLLSLNNDNTAIYTSGYGYTDELPKPGYEPNQVRPEDMWCWAEAQEMTVVSPAMHEEFVFTHEKRLLEPFGLNGYGCCDDLTKKLDFVLSVPNLRRVSVSPWADVELCAERIKGNVIFMWKPQPAHLVGNFNKSNIQSYLRRTVEVTRAQGCSLEIVLLDTHTCEYHPERFDEWTMIAHQAVTN